MEGALAWISQIAAWVGQFIPRWEVLDTTQGAVKFVRGSRIIAQTAGVVIWWPVLTKCLIHPIARQATDLRPQTIVTRDGKTFVVGGLIVYEIDDIEKIVAHTFDPDETIRDVSLSVIHDVCIQHDAAELQEGARTGTLDRAFKAEARKQLATFGVRTLKLTLTDLAPCRVIRLVGSAAAVNFNSGPGI